MSESIIERDQFNKAFLDAQKEMPTVPKTRTADMERYSYKYADLGDVLAAALPILHKHGLALSQPLASEDGRIGVGTRIYHTGGHVEHFGVLLLSAGNSPQSAGSAITYARRYAACAALGIVADEDDDGRVAAQALTDDQIVTKLQNRLKALALELAAGDTDFARTVYEAHAPVSWTLSNVEEAEGHMREVLGG